MRENRLLIDRLISYSHTDMYPFHMPGHKRCVSEFPNPYSIDITEIEGFDNLHHPKDVLKESMEQAASVYGADRTYYLVNGSTVGILSAVLGTVKRGGRILAGRNCHKSAYHAMILGGLEPEYVYPHFIGSLGIEGGILPEDVETILSVHPDIQAVLIVSPTYDGIVSDIRGIAGVAHRYGIPLIVDEAHGAHLPFGRDAGFPEPALPCGADVVIQSLHKTLPSFTQTAVLHMRDGRVGRERLERCLQMFESSSPSYLLIAGIESCIDRMAGDGGALMGDFSKRIRQVREQLALMEHMRLVGRELCGLYGIWDLDESKIVVSVRDCVWMEEPGKGYLVDGAWLCRVLREEFHLEMEMCGADYIVAITTFCDTWEGLQRLIGALLQIDGRLKSARKQEGGPYGGRMEHLEIRGMAEIRPVIKESLSRAVDACFEELDLTACAGRVSAEFIYLYPPGIPIVAPGELVTGEIVDIVMCYREMGLPVQGMADPAAWKLRVIK